MKAFLVWTLVLGLSLLNADSGQQTTYIDTGLDPDEWVVIPAGEYFRGMHNHITNVPYDFEIMLTDVTNAQYVRYLNEAFTKGTITIDNQQVVGYYPGDLFDRHKHEFEITEGMKLHVPLDEAGIHIQFDNRLFTAERGYENHPMVFVSWFGAKAYADFYGWRLPTEIEWEKAARGTDDTRAYPWGDEIERNQANFISSHNLFEKLFQNRFGTTPVGFYDGETYNGYVTKDGRSPYGLYDMAGNVWQWTEDDYPDMHYRYMRGGSQSNYEYNLTVWRRNSAGPDFYGMNVGFRCARDIKESK